MCSLRFLSFNLTANRHDPPAWELHSEAVRALMDLEHKEQGVEWGGWDWVRYIPIGRGVVLVYAEGSKETPHALARVWDLVRCTCYKDC